MASNIVNGEGYALANIDALGDQYGFRKIRKGLGVTAFGMNAICMPEGFATGRHFHDQQEEVYFVHQGRIAMTFGDGSSHEMGPGDVARVDASTVRQIANCGSGDAIYVVVGGKDGYVGRDGRLPEGEDSRAHGTGA